MGDEGRARTAAALVVGNELLSGKVQDENVLALARALRELGVRLERVVMILDDVEVIAREVRELSRQYDVLFTSGGVGPTHDDVGRVLRGIVEVGANTVGGRGDFLYHFLQLLDHLARFADRFLLRLDL